MSKMAPVYYLSEQEDEAERLQAIFSASLQNLIEAKEYLWTLFLNRDIILFSSTSNRSWFSFLNSLRKNTTVIWKGKRRLHTANSSGFHSLGREIVTQANPGISTADGSSGSWSKQFRIFCIQVESSKAIRRLGRGLWNTAPVHSEFERADVTASQYSAQSEPLSFLEEVFSNIKAKRNCLPTIL